MSSGGIDFKAKYYSLRSRYVTAIDLAFRSGYEQGYNDGSQSQQQQMMAGMQGMGMPQQGAPEQGAPQGAPQQGAPEAEAQDQQLNEYIQTLESLVNKSEPSVDDLKKSISNIKKIQAEKAHNMAMKKIASTGYKNLNHKQKQAVSMQEKIVNDLMNKWENEEKDVAKTLTRLASTEALTRGK